MPVMQADAATNIKQLMFGSRNLSNKLCGMVNVKNIKRSNLLNPILLNVGNNDIILGSGFEIVISEAVL
jgi:hypothetical protein